MFTFSVTVGELTCTASLPSEHGGDAFTDIANRTVAAAANALETLSHTASRLDTET